MSPAMLSHKDYTVAWICALPLEMAAATAMLDETHPKLSQLPTDHNSYTLGQIGNHNVVVACLPSGVYGTISAAIVLSHLLPTYPEAQFGLMVGIGGGVPSKAADIRLGDVVVSKPTVTSSGVVQYDYGKTVSGGRLQTTSSSNKPPQLLLTAISQIQASYMMGKKQITEIISDTLDNNPEMRVKFARPKEDWLFPATYEHQYVEAECGTCDRNQLVNREPRATDGPYIHYGLVASGDQLMRDAQTRDRIAREWDILCFEMEAAGLMDQLPCLVIRGICDYCDSHKNKQSQGYAALTAAVYAKELLMVVAPTHARNDEKVANNPWTVPFAKNPRFVGRQQEIAKLEQMILQENGPRKIAIAGLGGVGKTQVVLELAHCIRDKYAEHSIFWVPSTSIESIEQAYLNISQQLGMKDVKPAEVKTLVQSHLSQDNAGKWLLIFDNADDMDMWMKGSDESPALKDLLPHSKQGCVLFTTRTRKLAVKLASSSVVQIQEMDEKTATDVLRQLLPVEEDLLDDTETTATLLGQLAFLPLAIAQAAAYISENGIGLADYTLLLKEQEEDVIELLSEDFEDDGRYPDIQNPVATTWLVSFTQIRRLDPLAADYLSLMACINPQDIPQSLLPPAASKKKRTDALGLLNAYFFISMQLGDEFLSLHRLVHLATRNWLRKEGLLATWISATVDRFFEVYPKNRNINWAPWRKYLPHALSLVRNEEFQNDESENEEFEDQSSKRRDLPYIVGQSLVADERYNEVSTLFKEIVERMKQRLGDDHIDTLVSKNYIGKAYLGLEQWSKAQELHVNSIETCKRVLGPEHPITLIGMNNLAHIYWIQGLQEAEELYYQVIETSKRALGPEHPQTLISMNNLANVYCDQDRQMEAEELCLQVMETRKRVLGPEHSETLTSMNNLALTYLEQDRQMEAEKLYFQVIETSKRVLGPEHPRTLLSMHNLAFTYLNQDRQMEAEELFVQVIDARKRMLGLEHADTLKSMSGLAFTYCKQRQLKESKELYEQVIDARKRRLELEHTDTLRSMHNLSIVLKDLGQDYDAITLMTCCIDRFKRILGPDHSKTISSIDILRKWQMEAIPSIEG